MTSVVSTFATRRPTRMLRARAPLLLGLLLSLLLVPPTGAAPTRTPFDHLTTGFELLGQHRDLPCESCHTNAIFKGTPKECSACHGVGTTVRATAKPTSHITSTDRCASCHTEVAWKPSVNFDHQQALGSCSSCHNNVQAQGKPPNHIVTDLECDACHTTVSWAGAMFTHVGVTGDCASCHNGVSAQGMPANHMPIGSPPTACEACHSASNFTNWLGATINHPAVVAMSCASCHETAAFLGMHPSTNTAAGDSRPNATLDPNHATGLLATADCSVCHDTTTFAGAATKPPNHIPTSAPCVQCHTTPGQNATYSVTGVHQGVTGCLSCHGPGTGPFINVTIVTPPANHMPIGGLDCNGSGCHTTSNVNPGGFRIGAAAINAPTLTGAGHTTVAAANGVGGCQTCHQSAPYLGMMVGTSMSAAGDDRPTSYDSSHPTTGDCNGCHTTTPVFATNQSGSAAKPANHIPTSAPCAQCHTTAGNYAQYSSPGTHQGVTGCLTCHGSTVNTTFLNVTPVTTPGNHIPIGSLDCNGSGCHSTANVTPGGNGFLIGTASVNAPTLTVAGHATVAGSVPLCGSCHEQGVTFLGMIMGSSAAWGDDRPLAYDGLHPAKSAGDCSVCHTTTPTFASNMTSSSKPANHIPTTAPCAQCHTTINNYAVYSSPGTHQGVSGCVQCHGSTVNKTFANVVPVTTPVNHIPIGNVDCNASGCHTTTNVTVGGGGLKLGTANINSPTLNVAGHTSIAPAAACNTCHEAGTTYLGMTPSVASPGADTRPNAYLPAHPAAPQDCGNCHVTAPTFASNQLPTATKPANHIPTTAVCAQCHTTAGDFSVYSVTGVHQGVTTCNACHGPGTGPFAGPPPGNTITIVGYPGSPPHIPTGGADCGSSGCHTTNNVNTGGFKIGSASISNPTLNVAGHTTISAAATCQTCHESAQYLGMMVGTSMSAAGDDRPTKFDSIHPTSGDCSGCHTTTPVFANDQTGNAKPANHIPTNAACAQCHTTAGNFTLYSSPGTHQGVTGCLTCHGSTVNTTFANVVPVTTPSNHIPIGGLDCNGSGCHSTANVTPGGKGFNIGSANISTPTLTVAGHTTIAAANGVSGCQTCHQSSQYLGMMVGTSMSAAGDDRPTKFDSIHPTSGDCNGCHTTTPVFANNQTSNAKPANHIPTNAACAQCHTTAGNFTLYSSPGTHQGVSGCLTCHGSTVNTTFANVVPVTTPSNHIPIGGLDCNGSGCHSTTNVTPGGNGFRIGAASVNTPTLTVPGHTTIAATNGVSGCQTCHQSSQYLGMVVGTSMSAYGDDRPTKYDSAHPTSGDCSGCHTTTPTFYSNQTAGSKPANHIPTNAACTQCHTTAGNYAAYVMGATGHAGITNNCAQCHAYGLSFYNMAPPTLVEPPSGATGHIPAVPPNGTSAIACELCHSPSAFTTFSGTVMKHAYVTAMKCDSCHEYGMKWKTNTGVQLWTRPSTGHHAGQDCGGSGCHTSRDKHALTRAPAPARATTPTTTVTARTGGVVARAPTGSAAASAQSVAAVAEPVARAGGVLIPATAGAGVPFNHGSVASAACVSCHSGASSGGKPAGHIASSNACQSCHTTLAWLPVTRVDHTQVLGACASCHNGAIAKGKPSSHLPTTAACESCHTTIAWTPARFDHAAVTPHTCITCHNAVRATGVPRAHIPTTQSCDACHGTLAWSPVRVDHVNLTASCASCHNNIGAIGLSPGHLRTQIDCVRCHGYPDWSAVKFRHTSAAYPAGRHAKLACTSCHTTDTDQVPYPSVADAGSCAGCHASDFKPAAHPKTAKSVSYSAHELADCSGACHVYSDTTQSTITRRLPGPHHRATDATLRR